MDSNTVEVLIKKEINNETEVMDSCEDERSINFNVEKDPTLITDFKFDPEKEVQENASEQRFEISDSSVLNELDPKVKMSHSEGSVIVETASNAGFFIIPEVEESLDTVVSEKEHNSCEKNESNSIKLLKVNAKDMLNEKVDDLAFKQISDAANLFTTFVEKQEAQRAITAKTNLGNYAEFKKNLTENNIIDPNPILNSECKLKNFIKKEIVDDGNLIEVSGSETYLSENNRSFSKEPYVLSEQSINSGTENPLMGSLCTRSSINQTDELIDIVNENRDLEIDAMSSATTEDMNTYCKNKPSMALENIDVTDESNYNLEIPVSILQSRKELSKSLPKFQSPVENPSSLLKSFEQWNQDNNSVVMTELLKTMQNVLLGNIDIHTSYEFGVPSAWEIHNHNNGPVVIIQKPMDKSDSHFIPITVEKSIADHNINSSEDIIDVASEASVEILPTTNPEKISESQDVELIKTKISSCSVRLARISDDLIASFTNRQQKTPTLNNALNSRKIPSKSNICDKCGRTFKLDFHFERHRCVFCDFCRKHFSNGTEYTLHLKHCGNTAMNSLKSSPSSATRQSVKRSFSDTESIEKKKLPENEQTYNQNKKKCIENAAKVMPEKTRSTVEHRDSVDSEVMNKKISDERNKVEVKGLSSKRKRKQQRKNSNDSVNPSSPVDEDNDNISTDFDDTPVLKKNTEGPLKMKIIKSNNSTQKIQLSGKKKTNVKIEEPGILENDSKQSKLSNPIKKNIKEEKQDNKVDQKLTNMKKKVPLSSLKKSKLNLEETKHASKKYKSKGKKTYFCTFCYKTFHNSTSFKLHVSFHKGNNPYHCPICQLEFNDPSIMKDHVSSHKEGNPYMCHICGMGFARFYNFYKHAKIGHKLLPKSSRSG